MTTYDHRMKCEYRDRVLIGIGLHTDKDGFLIASQWQALSYLNKDLFSYKKGLMELGIPLTNANWNDLICAFIELVDEVILEESWSNSI